VDDAAVAAALVPCGRRFLFQQGDSRAGALNAQFAGGGGADDAGADDDDVEIQLRLQTDKPFSIGNALTQPSLSI
jgi:hypothetical protein